MMLKDYCIGDSVEYISVEYAKSSRSACRTCKQKIGQDELRVGILVDDDHFSTGQGTQWFHKACFHFKPRHKILEIKQLNKKIHNLQSLKKTDQKDIIAYLRSELEAIKQGKSRKKAAEKSKSKRKIQEEKKEEVKQEMTKRQTRSRSQAGKKLQTQTQPESQKEVKPQKVKKVNAKPKKEAPKKFITPTQAKQYKQLQQQLNKMTLNQLKDMLGKNNQAKTGTKPELVARCADGKQFGRIPTCHKCGGGKLRFNRDLGTYVCPGYMEDTDFINCGAKFTFDEVKRLDWVE